MSWTHQNTPKSLHLTAIQLDSPPLVSSSFDLRPRTAKSWWSATSPVISGNDSGPCLQLHGNLLHPQLKSKNMWSRRVKHTGPKKCFCQVKWCRCLTLSLVCEAFNMHSFVASCGDVRSFGIYMWKLSLTVHIARRTLLGVHTVSPILLGYQTCPVDGRWSFWNPVDIFEEEPQSCRLWSFKLWTFWACHVPTAH